MAETSRVVNGFLEITKTNGSEVFTLSREDVVRKIAEIQTKIDHLNIDLAEIEVEKTKWDNRLEEIDEYED